MAEWLQGWREIAAPPDAISPIIAMRAWAWDRNGMAKTPRLMAWASNPIASRDYLYPTWRPGVNCATCRLDNWPSDYGRHTNPAPSVNCRCGFWGLADATRVPTECWRSKFDFVSGIVKMWGRIVVGEYGFRAEYASVERLFHDGRRRTNAYAAIQELATFYGVPAVKFSYDQVPELTQPSDLQVQTQTPVFL